MSFAEPEPPKRNLSPRARNILLTIFAILAVAGLLLGLVACANEDADSATDDSSEYLDNSVEGEGDGAPVNSPRNVAALVGEKNAPKVEASFRELQRQLPVHVSVALAPVQSGEKQAPVAVLGESLEMAAWSTSKVPIAVAALERNGESVLPQVNAAITVSDNDAAESLWRSLGGGFGAGAAMREQLSANGDGVTIPQTQHVYSGFTSFGQTMWTVPQQAQYAAHFACQPGSPAEQVRQAMAQVDRSQAYGLGSLPEAHFKGGWGPNQGGGYDARQFGYFRLPDGKLLAVAIAAHDPVAGMLSDQLTGALQLLAQWVTEHGALWRGGSC
ncbi:MAG: hypothetical protein WAN89_03595 [Lawsonella sp.]